MAPTMLLTHNTLSPNIALSEFTLLETTQTTQEIITTTTNATTAMDPIIAVFTRQYFNACKQTGHIVDS